MTKLYHNAECWQVPGKQDKKAERHDVPNPPEGLAAWLNERGVPSEPIMTDELHVMAMREAIAGIAGERENEREGLASEQPLRISPEMVEQRRMAMGRCPRCNGTPRGAHLLLKGEEKDAILAWIEDADELWMIEAIALAVRDRVRALGLASGEQGGVQ